jgi:hypothetical protein
VTFIDEECALSALQHVHGMLNADGTPLMLTIQVRRGAELCLGLGGCVDMQL